MSESPTRKDSLEWLAAQAVERTEPVRLLEREDVVQLYHRPTGKVELHVRPPKPRCHTVYTIADFALAVARWHSAAGVIFHNQDQLMYVLNDEDRRDRVVMPLLQSELFRLLCDLKDKQFDQRGFVRLLRYELAGCIPAQLVTAIAKIEVITNTAQRSEINPGRERGTREFAADLTSSGEIPDKVSLSLRAYTTPELDELITVDCGLEYTLPPQVVSFRLRPLPDEIDLVLRHLQGVLRASLQEALRTVFGEEHGGPTVLYGTV